MRRAARPCPSPAQPVLGCLRVCCEAALLERLHPPARRSRRRPPRHRRRPAARAPPAPSGSTISSRQPLRWAWLPPALLPVPLSCHLQRARFSQVFQQHREAWLAACSRLAGATLSSGMLSWKAMCGGSKSSLHGACWSAAGCSTTTATASSGTRSRSSSPRWPSGSCTAFLPVRTWRPALISARCTRGGGTLCCTSASISRTSPRQLRRSSVASSAVACTRGRRASSPTSMARRLSTSPRPASTSGCSISCSRTRQRQRHSSSTRMLQATRHWMCC
mmetsp:Transcript_45817/g.146276  ORF Transcript_45817/g.146276 Transcript_45817/m.146276 type:complete len:277 (-) Transcript_45817:981-1811(-)